MTPTKITKKNSLIKRLIILTEENVPEKNVDTTFSQPLQWILCQDRLAKILNFFFKNLPPDSQKKRQNSAKKIIKKSFLEEILLKF